MNIRTLRASVRIGWPLYAGIVLCVILALAAIALVASRRAGVPAAMSPGDASGSRDSAGTVDQDRGRGDPERERLLRVFKAATGHEDTYQVDRFDGLTWVAPVQIVQLPFGEALLTEEEVNEGCHVCTGAVGIYYFKEEDGKVVVTGKWPRAIKGWGWGKPPSWQLTRKFTALPAIWEAGHEMHMGIESRGASLTELRPAGPARSDPIDTSHQDDGAPDPNGRGTCSVRGEIVNVRPDVGFDVQLTGDVTAVDRYRKRNGRFVAASKIDWENLCPKRGPPPPDA